VATRHAIVQHAEGLHVRPAEQVAQEAMRHASTIVLVHGSRRVDAKSILDVLTLGARQGSKILVEAIGTDAEVAADSLAKLVESDFAFEKNNQGDQG
jgi:phosphocarrier protein HPr